MYLQVTLFPKPVCDTVLLRINHNTPFPEIHLLCHLGCGAKDTMMVYVLSSRWNLWRCRQTPWWRHARRCIPTSQSHKRRCWAVLSLSLPLETVTGGGAGVFSLCPFPQPLSPSGPNAHSWGNLCSLSYLLNKIHLIFLSTPRMLLCV